MDIYKDGNIKNVGLNKKLHQLYLKSEQLRKLRKITNECLSAGAYGEKNMEMQEKNFEEMRTPEWEREIIRKAWDYKKKQSHKLLRELSSFIDELGGNEDGEKN